MAASINYSRKIITKIIKSSEDFPIYHWNTVQSVKNKDTISEGQPAIIIFRLLFRAASCTPLEILFLSYIPTPALRSSPSLIRQSTPLFFKTPVRIKSHKRPRSQKLSNKKDAVPIIIQPITHRSLYQKLRTHPYASHVHEKKERPSKWNIRWKNSF